MKQLKIIGLLALLAALGLFAAALTIDRWLFVVLDPGDFDASKTPVAPDFSHPEAWAAHPTVNDEADVSLSEHPAIDPETAEADVFYVHPTTWVGSEWNGPWDDAEVIEATARGGTLIQASVFNACCAVYGPRYRQANGKAFVDPDPNGDRAIEVAYSDVRAAFRFFLERYSRNRPFFVAAHSQGTVLATRLLREEVEGKGAATRLVAAYLLGGPVTADSLGLPVCRSERQFGCLVAFNSRGPLYRSNNLELKSAENRRPGRDPMAGWLCVNPLSWTTAATEVPASAHSGALFLDAPTPQVFPGFASAQCRDGRLLVAEIGEVPRDPMSRILDWIMGPQNYHPIEYQLFYLPLRANALARLDAWRAARVGAPVGAAPDGVRRLQSVVRIE